MKYKPVVFFRAKCFAPTPISVIFGKHYEATFDKGFKTSNGALNFARKQIYWDEDVWQLPASKEVRE